VLYETTPTNGTTKITSIVLSQVITNFDEIEVYYNTNDSVDYKCTRKYPVNQDSPKFNIELDQWHPTASNMYAKFTRYDLAADNKTLGQYGDGQVQIGSTATWTYNNDQTHCRIYKVIGIKYQ
jgi:hypothetical protein